jgi:hypothetical protein
LTAIEFSAESDKIRVAFAKASRRAVGLKTAGHNLAATSAFDRGVAS